MRDELRVVVDCIDALVDFVGLASEHGPLPLDLHARWRQRIDDTFESASKQGIPRAEVEALLFPLIALVDELALRDDALRAHWMSEGPLQLHYFQENVAGETFFTRLDQELGGARRKGVLYLHYLSLMLGFRGKHANDPEALEAVIGGLTATVVPASVQYPPEHVVPPPVVRPPQRDVRWAPVLVALLCVVFSLVFVARSRCAVEARIHDTIAAVDD